MYVCTMQHTDARHGQRSGGGGRGAVRCGFSSLGADARRVWQRAVFEDSTVYGMDDEAWAGPPC